MSGFTLSCRVGKAVFMHCGRFGGAIYTILISPEVTKMIEPTSPGFQFQKFDLTTTISFLLSILMSLFPKHKVLFN
jgi:hypothetical protein